MTKEVTSIANFFELMDRFPNSIVYLLNTNNRKPKNTFIKVQLRTKKYLYTLASFSVGCFI